MKEHSDRLIAQNKKAYHDFFIEDKFQAGLSLVGTEVKSLRAGKCNLKESYIRIEGNSAFIEGMHISPYEQGSFSNQDPVRKRRLLLHRREINKLRAATSRDGYTVVPLKVYFWRQYVKLDIALAKGKKLYDKRDAMAKKDQQRDAQRQFAQRI